MPYALGRFFTSQLQYYQQLERLAGHWPTPYGIRSRFSPSFRRAVRLAANYLQHRLTRNLNT